jgi:hypothetical protein
MRVAVALGLLIRGQAFRWLSMRSLRRASDALFVNAGQFDPHGVPEHWVHGSNASTPYCHALGHAHKLRNPKAAQAKL